MKLDGEALRGFLRARASRLEVDRLVRQQQAILRTLQQAAAFAADVRAGKVVVIPKGVMTRAVRI